MKLVVIGTGYVGLVSGACLSELGNNVICVDKDESKINKLLKGQIPIYEPGLETIVERNLASGRLAFTTNLKEALKGADCVLLAVGTPTDEEKGRADLSFIFAATEEVAKHLEKSLVVITKSTVPVGTGKKVYNLLREKRPDLDCHVVSNPEFLREGSAVEDFMKPDRIIIGVECETGKDIAQRLYQKLIGEGYPVLFTNIPTAELIKYSSNAYLAMKIAYANEIADVCEGVGANVELVIKGMGMDKRIGAKHMKPGPGYGGSCFPKDTLALTGIAEDAGFPVQIVEAVIKSNEQRKERMADKIIKAVGGDVKNKKIAILGLTFKANTDDMRYSPSLSIIPKLLDAGARVSAYDPVGMDESKKFLQRNIEYCSNAISAIKGADAMAIITEWDEFRHLDLNKVKKSLKGPVIVDLRNIFDQEKVEEAGLKYFSIGK